jgi:very-short-patch-repair endonuclease
VSLVLTRDQAVTAGWSTREVAALVRSGRWRTLRRGTYLTGPELPEDPQAAHAVLVLAAVLASGVPAVGSHRSAAFLHGLPLLGPVPAEPVLTRIRTAGQARPDGRRSAGLVAQVPPWHRAQVVGAPVTSLARTALDLARSTSEVEAVVVLDAALRSVGHEELQAVLEVQRGWTGSVRAVRRLLFADGLSESALESVGRLRFAEQGLPRPRLQVVVGDEHGPVARTDFLWDEERTVGEADGRLKYGDDPAALWEEKLREDRLRDLGFEVVRFGWSEALHRPEQLADRVRRAFARGRRRSAA